jgi:hypothetical protein
MHTQNEVSRTLDNVKENAREAPKNAERQAVENRCNAGKKESREKLGNG